MEKQYSFVMFKPLALKKGLVSTIKKLLEQRGAVFEECKRVRVSRPLISKHYAEHRSRPFFSALVDYYDGKRVIACRVSGPRGIINTIRRTLGPSDPLLCIPDEQIRALAIPYARTGETCQVDNLVHASDSPASARRELNLWGLSPRGKRAQAPYEYRGRAASDRMWRHWNEASDIQQAREIGRVLFRALAQEGVAEIQDIQVNRAPDGGFIIWFLPDFASLVPIYLSAGEEGVWFAKSGGSKGRFLGTSPREIARNIIRISEYRPSKVADIDIMGLVRAAFSKDAPRVAAKIPPFQAVFLMGLPGAGKSSLKARKYLRHVGFLDLDADEIKKTHPDFDPARIKPEIHEWAFNEAARLFRDALKSGQSFILDATGTDAAKLAKKIQEAKDAGFKTHVVYVYVPVEIALFRNRNRAGKGGRFVPEDKILDKARRQDRAFIQIRNVADRAKVVPNYDEAELKQAKRDLLTYPAPQSSPPPRPGDPSY